MNKIQQKCSFWGWDESIHISSFVLLKIGAVWALVSPGLLVVIIRNTTPSASGFAMFFHRMNILMTQVSYYVLSFTFYVQSIYSPVLSSERRKKTIKSTFPGQENQIYFADRSWVRSLFPGFLQGVVICSFHGLIKLEITLLTYINQLQYAGLRSKWTSSFS